MIRRWHAIAAVALALIVAVAAWHWGARTVGGADSHGYASQADAWLDGTLVRPQTFLERHPPPFSRWAFSPLGWRPVVDGYGIVPVYAPGLSLLMAAAKAMGGHAAMFAIVPLCAGLLVWVAYLLGCRLGLPRVGLAAALLVAASATVTYLSLTPMSDVPSAALWSLALALALGTSWRAAGGAGLALSAAMLVRPNLAPLVALCLLRLLVDDLRARRVRRWWQSRALVCLLALAPGVLFLARHNATLYGSPFLSGYGRLDQFYAWSHVAPNATRFVSWLSQAESWWALVALLGVLLPIRFLHYGAPGRRWASLMTPMTACVLATYLGYLVFDDWWYLRFLLPIWPAMAVSAVLLLAWLWHAGGVRQAAAVALAVFVVVKTLAFGWEHSRTIGLTESRYAQVAQIVATVTEPDAAIITLQHSGSVRYYGGRMTVRWDVIEPTELDGAIAWLIGRGHHPYLLLDRFEVDRLRANYAKDSAIGALNWTPRLSFFKGETLLFDINDRGRTFVTSDVGAYTRRAVPPAPQPHWQ
jgi:hypothetical protein